MNKTTASTIDIDYSASHEAGHTIRAIADLIEGLRKYELWITMGLQDLRRGYRRSVLGPLWLTLSLAILVTALGLLYGALMGTPKEVYIPHLALGFIAWNFIHGVITDSCNVF